MLSLGMGRHSPAGKARHRDALRHIGQEAVTRFLVTQMNPNPIMKVDLEIYAFAAEVPTRPFSKQTSPKPDITVVYSYEGRFGIAFIEGKSGVNWETLNDADRQREATLTASTYHNRRDLLYYLKENRGCHKLTPGVIEAAAKPSPRYYRAWINHRGTLKPLLTQVEVTQAAANPNL